MLTLIIPHYNDHVHIAELIRSLQMELEQIDKTKVRVLIMDDGSSQESCTALRSLTNPDRPWLEIHFAEKNQGPAAVRNEGASKACSEWIWFLDADVVLCKGALARALDLLSEARLNEEPKDVIVTSVSANPLASKGYARHKAYLNYLWQPQEGPTTTLDSKSFLIRRKTFLEIEGFSQRFKTASVEDYELGFRMLERGLKLFFTRDITILHFEPSFFTQLKLYFERSSRWMKLKRVYGLRFDDNGTTMREAVTQLLGFSVLAVLLAGAFQLALVLFLGFAAFNSQRLLFLMRKGENPFFLAAHLLYAIALSVPVLFGSLYGLCSDE